MKLYNAKIATPEGIVSGSVTIEDNIITDIAEGGAGDVDAGGRYIVPGFVDIHCHGGGDFWHFENPAEAAKWHLMRGTTSLLCSMWRNAGDYSYEKAVLNVKAAMGEKSNIRGVHMEGPYLDPELGSEGGRPYPVNPAEYEKLMALGEGIIKTWTIDPMQAGTEDFAREAQKNGIKLGVCYSKASPEVLEEYVKYGLSIGSHIFCATGAPKTMFVGTKEPGSDVFVLCRDDMTAEVIADSLGGHVRAYNLKLIYKCKGAGGIALVSDYCPGGETLDSDVNIINGELYGSRLSLSVALKNMGRHTGATLEELVKMTSETPARAIGIFDRRGSLEKGKIADIAVLDENLDVRGVMLGGEFVRKDF